MGGLLFAPQMHAPFQWTHLPPPAPHPPPAPALHSSERKEPGDSFFWLRPLRVTTNWWPLCSGGHSPDLALSSQPFRLGVVTGHGRCPPRASALSLATFLHPAHTCVNRPFIPFFSNCPTGACRLFPAKAPTDTDVFRCRLATRQRDKRPMARRLGQAPSPGRCPFLSPAGQEDRGCRSGWSMSTLAASHQRNFRRPPGTPPPGGGLSPASAWSQELLKTVGPDPNRQGRTWVRGKTALAWESGCPGFRQDFQML